jgi:hypothetical protein
MSVRRELPRALSVIADFANHRIECVVMISPEARNWWEQRRLRDTDGICPSCLQRWTLTQCLNCGGWSPHSQWYAK